LEVVKLRGSTRLNRFGAKPGTGREHREERGRAERPNRGQWRLGAVRHAFAADLLAPPLI